MLGVTLAGCRGLLGIDDPTLAADARPGGDAMPDAPGCGTNDFDNDGTFDGCDLCPMLPGDANDQDSDGDGVGDGCDPHPTEPIDQRTLWTAFRSQSDIADWTPTDGTWIVDPARGLVQSNKDASARIALPGTHGLAAVMTELTVIEHGQAPQAGLCTNVTTTSNGRYRCCDVNTPQSPTLLTWNEASQAVSMFTGSISPGQSLTLFEESDTSSHDRALAQGNVVVAPAPLTSTLASGQIVLHVREIAVAYRYVFVVTPRP